jgi:hypothetical protein
MPYMRIDEKNYKKNQISTRNFSINCHLYKKDFVYGQHQNR